MPETVNALRIKVEIFGGVIGDDGAKLEPQFQYDVTFTDGTGAEQIQKVWQDLSRALDTTSEDLDLGAGGLADFQGAELNPGKIKVIALKELGGVSSLTLKPGGTNPATTLQGGTSPTLVTGAGGLILIVDPSAAGRALTDGSADRLAVETDADTTYQVLIAG